MDFKVNVNVTVGVTPMLEGLIKQMLGNATTTTPQPAQQHSAAAKGVASEQAETQPQPSKAALEVPQAEAEAATPTAPPNDEDMRAAMHRTRLRIQGEDYKDNAESEGNKKYKRKLTAYFKQISAMLGADKPTQLEGESRTRFVELCEEIVVEEGEITTQVPF